MKHNKLISELLKLKAFSIIIGYAETGEPVELVYDVLSDTYELHLAGEYVADAPTELVTTYKNQL